MPEPDCDILISGGGVAGLAAACAFGQAGFSTVCVDPNPPITDENHAQADLRTTAFLQPARNLFERIGVWHLLAPHATALRTMRIVDAGGKTTTARETADFVADDISDTAFGWNLPNWILRREMLAFIGHSSNINFLPGVATQKLVTRSAQARVSLDNGTTIATRLLVAADGRNSMIRQHLGIAANTWRYGQKALAFMVTHTAPHNNISTEVHRNGGPFTLVPMSDLNGKPRSAVVWMDRGPEICALADLPVSTFNGALNARAAGQGGVLTLAGRRSVWPIISQHAQSLIAQRTVLIAEAAHVVPPIGAQGLNMSIADIRTLLDLATASPQDLGAPQMLGRYQRARMPDILARLTGIDVLNRAAMANAPALRDMRRLGLKTLHGIAPLRKTLMRAGLGLR